MKTILILLFGLLSCLVIEAQELGSGRQLFVDDHVIDSTTLQRQWHYPSYSPLNPVLKADQPWEFGFKGDPYAAPFSGGVWFDDADHKFKMWYSAGGGKTDGLVTCYAESEDGKHWIKPLLNVVPGTNIVDTLEHDCVSVLLDRHETDPQRRFKLFAAVFRTPKAVTLHLRYSPDGIHWSESVATSGEIYDRTGVYYDTFRKHYVLSLKTLDLQSNRRRSRDYLAGADPELLVSLAHRTFDKHSDKYIRFWFGADEADPRHELFPNLHPQIYNHEAMPYESLLLGYFTVWQGPENDDCDRLEIQKKNEVLIGWSRDGFTWQRPDRTPFLPVGAKGEWHEGNVQSTNGNPIIVGDSLYFYVSGRYNNPKWDSNFTTGLATLRRDGFASMSGDGHLTTKPFIVSSRHLFVNASLEKSMSIEVINAKGRVVKCFELQPFNSTSHLCCDLSMWKGKQISLRFTLFQGDFYAFWLSNTRSGESCGAMAGGIYTQK